jgi:hypothetical protein
MRFKKFLVKGGVKLDHGGGARIDHSLGRRKLIVAFSAATHSFKTQAKETRRTSEIASQNAGFTRPSGDVPFQEGTEFPHFFWQFPSSVADLVELQRYGRVNEFAHRHRPVDKAK